MTSKLDHIAIIMDGNRRWAINHHCAVSEGHKKGAEVAKEIIQECSKLGIKWLTLYTFSSENWQRGDFEVGNLMSMLEFYLIDSKKLLIDSNIRFQVIGDISKLPSSIRKKIVEYEDLTRKASGLHLIIALNYGSKQEIVSACKNVLIECQKGKLKIEEITEELFANFLYTDSIPDPDLLIRTSGEQRMSNFLLWQLAYAELYFTTTLWPDFTPQDLAIAVDSYKKRKRKYGAA